MTACRLPKLCAELNYSTPRVSLSKSICLSQTVLTFIIIQENQENASQVNFYVYFCVFIEAMGQSNSVCATLSRDAFLRAST